MVWKLDRENFQKKKNAFSSSHTDCVTGQLQNLRTRFFLMSYHTFVGSASLSFVFSPLVPPSTASVPVTCSARPKRRGGASRGDGKPSNNETDSTSTSSGAANGRNSKKRYLSAESRAKISAALRGRRKSDTHREKLRKRLSGEKNPMYGRKMSAETRAKISRSLSSWHRGYPVDDDEVRDELAKTGKENDEVKENGEDEEGESEKMKVAKVSPISEEENLKRWRERAETSRLMQSYKEAEDQKDGGRQRQVEDSIDEVEIDKVLERVAKLDMPPDNIARLIHQNHFRRSSGVDINAERNDEGSSKDSKTPKEETEGRSSTPITNVVNVIPPPETRGRRKQKVRKVEKKPPVCTKCNGTGMIECPTCIGTIGVISANCPMCFGAGSIFCDACGGSGIAEDDSEEGN